MSPVSMAKRPSPILRPGPNGLGRSEVSAIQRARIIAAALDVAEAVGYSRVTVAQVTMRARVSRKTFYDIFLDREDCFVAAFEDTIAEVRGRVTDAYASQLGWRAGMRAALGVFLDAVDEDRGRARVCIVESLAGGEMVQEARSRLLAEVAEAIDGGRSAAGALNPPEVTAEALVGGLFAILHSRLLDDEGTALLDQLGPLMSMIVLPYLGARAARRELGIRAPKTSVTKRRIPRPSPSDPLEGLNMRLTYRTVRVLGAMSETPGASNRELAVGSGIVDQGQISKLLRRLAGLGLVENHGAGQMEGGPNAWHLTARGAKVARATYAR